jgi:predicted DNA-binding transcriptional regulator YafY
MNPEMRAILAREPFEEKIRKVERLVRLAQEFPREETESAGQIAAPSKAIERTIISAIRGRIVLEFKYSGQLRTVEPQTYGISVADHPVLRGYQRAGGSSSGRANGLRLFEVAKMSGLRKTAERFLKARPEHNPKDRAMKEVKATLPLPE